MRLYSTAHGIARETAPGELELLQVAARDLGELLRSDPDLAGAAAAAVRTRVPIDETTLLAPVPSPGCIYCVGANYESHVEEMTTLNVGNPEAIRATLEAVRSRPMFFTVPATATNAPYADIVLPEIAPTMVDYEIEVAAVIGRGGSAIPVEDALAAVAGLTLANDVSARDLQRRAMEGHEFEFGHAKGLDGFKPMGPCVVTLDEIADLGSCAIETLVNGESRQRATLGELIHDISACVAYVSRFHTLKPGDVILTGSPAGVGFFRGSFLTAGDTVEMTATGIGTLRNRIVSKTT
jgi:2-keto-4-pentenoate hydratase/2-oxohepta-3-ene-1,7-dioic acid hydratase in catechol pathway